MTQVVRLSKSAKINNSTSHRFEREPRDRVYLVLAATNALYARFLRWLMGSNVNHAMIVYMDRTWGDWWAVEVDERGVRLAPLYTLRERYLRYEFYRCDDAEYSLAFPAMRNEVGSKYDWLALGINVLRYIVWRISGKRWLSPLHSLSRMMCTEFMVHFMQKAGIDGADELTPSLTSPVALQDFFNMHSDIHRVEGAGG